MKKHINLYFILILLIVGIVLLPLNWGVGQNWDWTFPYFQDSTGVFLSKILSSWNPVDLGSPLSYSPHLYAAAAIDTLNLVGLPTEKILWLLVVIVLSITGYIGYLIVKKYDKLLAPLWALTLIINSAIFYKLLAGHLYYLLGFMVFLGLIYFLIEHYRPTIKSAVILGVIWSFTGVQTQFLVFSFLTICAYFITNRDSFKFRHFLLSLSIVLLLHFYWLVLFITGSTSFADVSSTASAESFGGLVRASLKSVLGLSFSPATFIRNFYSIQFVGYFSLLWVFVILSISIYRTRFNSNQYFIGISLLIFIFIVTGVFHSFSIPVLSKLYPILREVGHAAPVVILLLVILGATTIKGRVLRAIVGAYLVIFIAINSTVYFQSIPRISFESARQQLRPFENFNKVENSTTSRILTYPFFNQYSFLSEKTTIRGGTPMSNSGWDSFIIFSGKDYIENGIAPYEFENSLQRLFLRDYDVGLLSERNIRYIYDLSGIYESTYDRFVAPEIFENNLSLIKNDPDFIQKIIDRNPGRVRLVSPKILEIIDYIPRISGEGVTFEKITETRYEIMIENSGLQTNLDFITNYHPGWRLYDSSKRQILCEKYMGNECLGRKRLFIGDELTFFNKKDRFSDSHIKRDPMGNRWTITPDNTGPIYLTLYYRPQSWFVLGLLISLLTLLSLIIYLAVSKLKLAKSSSEVVVGTEGDASK